MVIGKIRHYPKIMAHCLLLILPALIFTQPVFSQQGINPANLYFPVYKTVLYENKIIPTFVQDVPVGFSDIIALHQEKIQDPINEINSLVKDAEKALSITPQNDTLLLKLAILYYERKDLGKAEKIFENLVNRSAKHGVDENSFFYLGLIAAERKAYKECKYYFGEVVRMDNKRANAHLNLGITYFYLNDYKRAADSFESALAINPKDAIAYFFTGLIKHKRGEENGAVWDFRWAKKLQPGSSVFNDWPVSSAVPAKELKKLQDRLNKYPHDPGNYYKIGWLYVNYGELDKAESYFRQALDINPRHGNSFFGLSEVYLYRGDFDKAESYAFKILEYEPDLRAFTYGVVGRIRVHKEDYNGAEKILKEAIAIGDPRDTFYSHALLGQIYLEENKLKEAKEELEECRRIGIKHPEVAELAMKVARYERIYGN